MDKDTALRKIQKCLALAKSSEPHEAARALAQAQTLMRQHDIDHPELLAAGVTEEQAPSRAVKTPPQYEVDLAIVVGRGFGCEVLRQRGWSNGKATGHYNFVGRGHASEVAAYTFAVLARKLQASRVEYARTKLIRYRKNKVAAADEYCAGWVRAVAKHVLPANLAEDEQLAIDAYVNLHNPNMSACKTIRRELANAERGAQHYSQGWRDGGREQVHDALSTASRSGQKAIR